MWEGIKQGIKETGISREDLFITSKVLKADLGYESNVEAYEAILKRLGVDYLDLYLIHWLVEEKYKEAWKALEYLYKDSYSYEVPSVYLMLGAGTKQENTLYGEPMHNENIVFNEDILITGAAMHTYCAIMWLKNNK